MKTIITQTETFRRSLQFTNVKSGEIIDLTGCSARSQMRKKPGDEWYSTAECSIDYEAGVVSALWTKEQTAQFPLGKLGYDIFLVAGDEQKPIFTEQVEVIQPYTEPEE